LLAEPLDETRHPPSHPNDLEEIPMRTSNPALRDEYFRRDPTAIADGVMTLQGTTTKSFLLILLTMFSASFTWREYLNENTAILMPALLVGGIGGFIVALIAIFKPRTSPITGPIYAVLEGLLLGAISAKYQTQLVDAPIQAVGLTLMVFLSLLLVYRTGMIKVTDNLRMGIVAATGGVALFYLVTFVLAMFGVEVPLIHGSGLVGIGFSLVVVAIASLNLVLDFDFIERGVAAGAPRYMEWYAAFGLLVTLVWLYLEILRLVGKLRR
jgi:uncharacterized YccA/Bax inhibitor family protein